MRLTPRLSIVYHIVRSWPLGLSVDSFGTINPRPLPQFHPVDFSNERSWGPPHGHSGRLYNYHSNNSPDHHATQKAIFDYILPIPCHSHNDYVHHAPLHSALYHGCISVEADVWLFDGELFIGHSRNSLDQAATLSRQYIEPLLRLLDQTNEDRSSDRAPNGVFSANPMQSLTLLIDFKTAGDETIGAVSAALEPLRERGYLTHWNGYRRIEGPVTVVVSGAATLEDIMRPMARNESAQRDIFLDAPLDRLVASTDPQEPLASADGLETPSIHEQLAYKYNPSNSYFASTKMSSVVGLLGQFSFGETEVHKIRNLIQQARDRGLLSRFWGAPNWPPSLRERTWTVLLKEKVGILNVDSFRAIRHLLEDSAIVNIAGRDTTAFA